MLNIPTLCEQEEILEIERKSSLLASAIDETIKCIEEYKEEVGIETKKEVMFDEIIRVESNGYEIVDEHKLEVSTESKMPIIYNGFSKVENKVFDIEKETKINEEWNHIEKQVNGNIKNVNELSKSVNIEIKESTDFDFKSTIMQTNEASSVEPNQESHKVIECNGTDTEHLNTFEIAEYPEKEDVIVNGVVAEQRNESPVDDVKPIGLKNAGFMDTSSSKYQVEDIVQQEDKLEAMEVKKEEMRKVKKDPLEGYRPVQFNPEELIAAKRNLQSIYLQAKPSMQREPSPSYMDASGELLGTHQGIVDGLEEAVVDAELAKGLGKPGMTEDKIAELISGESEMLREAHVMGLSRVLSSHMHRPDDSSVDFKKIKPIIESLKDSEVLKALNDELIKTKEEKKKEERKWTTFLQKPSRPVPRAKFGYYSSSNQEEVVEEPYKVKIVKQPKPRVAPDYKSEDFNTGPLPWEERALNEPPPPPVAAEDPILIPEEIPEFLEAVDPLPESEVPDLEDTGIPLPELKQEEPEPTPAAAEVVEEVEEEPVEELVTKEDVEETERTVEDMEQNRLAEQLLTGVQNMVDPNATVEQQLSQMRAQLAALAQLPGVIQQTLELVNRQLSQLTQQDIHTTVAVPDSQVEEQAVTQECVEATEMQTNGDVAEETKEESQVTVIEEPAETTTNEEESKPSLTEEEMEKLKKEEEEMLEEQRRIEKQKKDFLKQELMEQMKLEQESRQVKQRSTPRVGKPKPVFGPSVPQERPLVLPGGRKWRKPQDAYNEQFIAETLTAQAEIIRGKAKGINFMKYEKPPVSLDHLQQSETYKLIHNMEQTPMKRVEMLTPVIAEADYREKCRSVTPSSMENHTSYPQQVHP